MSIRLLVALYVTLWFLPAQVMAQQEGPCGKVPEFQNKHEETERLKGELNSKAQTLSRLAGSAQLGDRIESERRTLYQTADKIIAAQADAYLNYMFCTIIHNDNTLSTADKIKAVQEFKKGALPPSMNSTSSHFALYDDRSGENTNDGSKYYLTYNPEVVFNPSVSLKYAATVCSEDCVRLDRRLCRVYAIPGLQLRQKNMFGQVPLGKILYDLSNIYSTAEFGRAKIESALNEVSNNTICHPEINMNLTIRVVYYTPYIGLNTRNFTIFLDGKKAPFDNSKVKLNLREIHGQEYEFLANESSKISDLSDAVIKSVLVEYVKAVERVRKVP